MRHQSLLSHGKVGFALLLPIAFLLIPTSWFEARGSFCLIRRVFGVTCPGCGMTRAISCTAHGNLKKALHYNKLVIIVFPLLSYTWLRFVADEYRKYVSILYAQHHPYQPDQRGTRDQVDSVDIPAEEQHQACQGNQD